MANPRWISFITKIWLPVIEYLETYFCSHNHTVRKAANLFYCHFIVVSVTVKWSWCAAQLYDNNIIIKFNAAGRLRKHICAVNSKPTTFCSSFYQWSTLTQTHLRGEMLHSDWLCVILHHWVLHGPLKVKALFHPQDGVRDDPSILPLWPWRTRQNLVNVNGWMDAACSQRFQTLAGMHLSASWLWGSSKRYVVNLHL